jgi:hypothetical protein
MADVLPSTHFWAKWKSSRLSVWSDTVWREQQESGTPQQIQCEKQFFLKEADPFPKNHRNFSMWRTLSTRLANQRPLSAPRRQISAENHTPPPRSHPYPVSCIHHKLTNLAAFSGANLSLGSVRQPLPTVLDAPVFRSCRKSSFLAKKVFLPSLTLFLHEFHSRASNPMR